MTQEEITETKALIQRVIADRCKRAFVGKPLNETAIELIKSHCNDILRDLVNQGFPDVLDLLEWNVEVEGSSVKMLLVAKDGLCREDAIKALDFIWNVGQKEES